MTDPKQPNGTDEQNEDVEDGNEPGSLFDDPADATEDKEDPDYETEVFPERDFFDPDNDVDWGHDE